MGTLIKCRQLYVPPSVNEAYLVDFSSQPSPARSYGSAVHEMSPAWKGWNVGAPKTPWMLLLFQLGFGGFLWSLSSRAGQNLSLRPIRPPPPSPVAPVPPIRRWRVRSQGTFRSRVQRGVCKPSVARALPLSRRARLAHVTSPAAKRRPERYSSLYSGFRNGSVVGTTTGVRDTSRLMIDCASASWPRCP